MPKPVPNDPLEQLNVCVKASLLRKVRILLIDPMTGKVTYGALSALVTKLLNDYVDSKKKEPEE